MVMTDSISLYSTHMYTLRFAIVSKECSLAEWGGMHHKFELSIASIIA